jgi:hypothetical protein
MSLTKAFQEAYSGPSQATAPFIYLFTRTLVPRRCSRPLLHPHHTVRPLFCRNRRPAHHSCSITPLATPRIISNTSCHPPHTLHPATTTPPIHHA